MFSCKNGITIKNIFKIITPVLAGPCKQEKNSKCNNSNTIIAFFRSNNGLELFESKVISNGRLRLCLFDLQFSTPCDQS
jgi:hypothetical protein